MLSAPTRSTSSASNTERMHSSCSRARACACARHTRACASRCVRELDACACMRVHVPRLATRRGLGRAAASSGRASTSRSASRARSARAPACAVATSPTRPAALRRARPAPATQGRRCYPAACAAAPARWSARRRRTRKLTEKRHGHARRRCSPRIRTTVMRTSGPVEHLELKRRPLERSCTRARRFHGRSPIESKRCAGASVPLPPPSRLAISAMLYSVSESLTLASQSSRLLRSLISSSRSTNVFRRPPPGVRGVPGYSLAL
jgi:hypothetical protein